MSKKIDVHVHIGEDLYRRYTPQMALERHWHILAVRMNKKHEGC